MIEQHWGYWTPLLIGIFAAVYLLASVESDQVKNASPTKIRLLFVTFGLVCIYAGALGWHFEITLSRISISNHFPRVTGGFFILMGTCFLVSAFTKSRSKLLRDAKFIADDQTDSGNEGNISPADRVRNAHHRDKPGEDR